MSLSSLDTNCLVEKQIENVSTILSGCKQKMGIGVGKLMMIKIGFDWLSRVNIIFQLNQRSYRGASG